MLAEKRIRTRSFPNVETERLLARLEWMRANRAVIAGVEKREDLRANVREVVNVERELAYRGIRFTPVSDGRHLVAVPTSTARHIHP